MKRTFRRAAAAVGLGTAAAVVAGLLAAPAASADISNVTPNTAFASESKTVTLTFGGTGSGLYFLGGSATFTRLGAPSDSFTVDIDPTPSANGKTGTTESITFSDVGNGLGADGPANAGTYGITAQDQRGTADACTSCFTVQRGPALALSTVAPNAVRAGSPAAELVLTGAGFERGSRIEFLRPGTTTVDTTINANLAPPDDNDPTTNNDTTNGITTSTQLRRSVTVAATSLTGSRDVRITNVDGSTVTLANGFSVNGVPLTSTTPTGGNNDPSLGLTRVTFNGSGLSTTGQPFLTYTADPGGSTKNDLTIPGRVVTQSASSVTADFDLRNAAPQRYLPEVRNADGSSNTCSCAFTVAQAPSRVTTVTSLDSDTATAGTQKSQPAGTTQTFVVTGTGFAKGTRVVVAGTGVTTTAVQLLSDTQLRATLQSTAAAATGDRNVTAVRTDGSTSAACANCYTVTAAASPSPTGSPTPTPSGTASPSPVRPATPTVNVNPSTITASQKATVFGQASPGTRIEVYAYSRPSTTYALVRSATVGPDGAYSFEVGPSGNTRLFARSVAPTGSTDSESVVLTVRTSLNLKVARVGTRSYRFTGSTLPKRKGQLVTVFYESGSGSRTIASRARVAQDGTYNVVRTFSGGGTFTFFTGTGTDNNNAANNSNRVRVTIR